MAKRAEVDTSMWSDHDILSLSGPARAVYFWAFTNHRTGMSGIYRVARGQVALETGFDGKTLDRALAELQEGRFLFYDGRVMFVRTRVKRIVTRFSETVAKGIGTEVMSVGNHPFVALWFRENESHPWATTHVEKPEDTGDSDTPSIPPRYPHDGAPASGHITSVVGVVEQQPTQKDQLPSDFPRELVPHLDAAFAPLAELAERHRSKAITRRSLATMMMGRPHKPFVRAAFDFVAWADGKAQGRRDVLAGYRNWLDRCDDLAATEPLNGGAPRVTAMPTNRRPNAGDLLRQLREAEEQTA